MEVRFNKEDRVIVTLKDGAIYEGNVTVYCEETEVLTLKNLVHYPENDAIRGLMDFPWEDISDLKLVTDQAPPKGENDEGYQAPKHLRKITKREYFKVLNLQRSFRVLNTISATFNAAITDLQDSKMVGLCGKEALGRRKKLSVLALSTENGIYLFDIERLGNKVFDNGVRTVLESENIVKVVYDCRFLSDCLHHKYGISLNNIRDVEAEDIVVVFNERGTVRRHNRPFTYLIQLYLGIPVHFADDDHVNALWKNISHNVKLQSFLANYVSYLIPVHKSIEDVYLQKLADASKIYNDAIRNSDDSSYNNIIRDDKCVTHKEMTDLLVPKQRVTDTDTDTN